MVLTFLSDFTKRSADLWKTKKFVFNKTLEVNVDQDNKISWKGKHVLKDKSAPSTSLTLTQTEDKMGELELEWNSKGKPTVTLTSSDLLDGVEAELCVEGVEEGNLKATLGDDTWSAEVDVQYKGSNPLLDCQASFAYEKITFGVHGVLDTADGSPTEYDVGVRLDQDADRTYVLRTEDKFNQLKVAFYNKINKDVEIGAQVGIDTGKNKIGLQLGGSYVMDSNSKLRYALNDSADLQLAYEYKFSKTVKGFVGTKYSLSDNKLVDGFGYKMCFDC